MSEAMAEFSLWAVEPRRMHESKRENGPRHRAVGNSSWITLMESRKVLMIFSAPSWPIQPVRFVSSMLECRQLVALTMKVSVSFVMMKTSLDYRRVFRWFFRRLGSIRVRERRSVITCRQSSRQALRRQLPVVAWCQHHLRRIDQTNHHPHPLHVAYRASLI